MNDTLDCKMTDTELEVLWRELEDVPTYEDKDKRICLRNNWNGFEKGTWVEDIWHWFDDHHSKGVVWLMYGIEI